MWVSEIKRINSENLLKHPKIQISKSQFINEKFCEIEILETPKEFISTDTT